MASSFVPLGEQREEQDEIEAVPTRDRVKRFLVLFL